MVRLGTFWISALDAKSLKGLAPRPGLEPGTLRLTAECSTIELPRSMPTQMISAQSSLKFIAQSEKRRQLNVGRIGVAGWAHHRHIRAPVLAGSRRCASNQDTARDDCRPTPHPGIGKLPRGDSLGLRLGSYACGISEEAGCGCPGIAGNRSGMGNQRNHRVALARVVELELKQTAYFKLGQGRAARHSQQVQPASCWSHLPTVNLKPLLMHADYQKSRGGAVVSGKLLFVNVVRRWTGSECPTAKKKKFLDIKSDLPSPRTKVQLCTDLRLNGRSGGQSSRQAT